MANTAQGVVDSSAVSAKRPHRECCIYCNMSITIIFCVGWQSLINNSHSSFNLLLIIITPKHSGLLKVGLHFIHTLLLHDYRGNQVDYLFDQYQDINYVQWRPHLRYTYCDIITGSHDLTIGSCHS